MSTDHFCPKCGALLVQIGSEAQTAIYSCNFCGHKEYVEMSTEQNVDFLHQRSMLLGKVRKGIIDWEVTQWDTLRREIMDFSIVHQAARSDIYFSMAIVACLTKGFHNLDDKRYKECKQIFKITEKVYKRYAKNPTVIPQEMSASSPTEYEEFRQLYKKCKHDYQNRKLAYKVAFKVGKMFVPIPKI